MIAGDGGFGGSGAGESMLLVIPVPFRYDRGATFVEKQAANGLRRWSEHFKPLTVAAPLVDCEQGGSMSSMEWVPLSELEGELGLVAVQLPWGYGYGQYISKRRLVADTLRQHIARNRYLQFAIGGCLGGDWGAMAARIANQLGRSYAVHTDWVTHQMPAARQGGRLRALRYRFEQRAMRHAEHSVIKGAALGLFHGADCFDAYAPWCRRAELVHDVHVPAAMLPAESVLVAKAAQARSGRPLRLVYAGRAHSMKGPLDWVRAMDRLRQLGGRFEATWFGDGTELAAMGGLVSQLALAEHVKLPGSVSHDRIIRELVAADAIVFCHLSPESPRILIEALNQGTPLVGYRSAYPADLTKSGGGLLVDRGAVEALAESLLSLDQDRQRLATLIRQAAEVGRQLTDTAVFEHRANLIKSALP